MGFSKKMTFLKTAEDKKVVVGCNWTSKISQNVEKVPSSWEKKIGFSKKNLELFLKPLKATNLMQNATELVRFHKNIKFYVPFEKP